MLSMIVSELIRFPERKQEMNDLKRDIENNIANTSSLKSIKMAQQAYLFFTGKSHSFRKEIPYNFYQDHYKMIRVCLFILYVVFCSQIISLLFFPDFIHMSYMSLTTMAFSLMISRHGIRKIKSALIREDLKHFFENMTKKQINTKMKNFYAYQIKEESVRFYKK